MIQAVSDLKIRRLSEPVSLSMNEAAAELSICRVTLWRLARDGKIPFCKIGRRVLFRPEDLRAFMAKGVGFTVVEGSKL